MKMVWSVYLALAILILGPTLLAVVDLWMPTTAIILILAALAIPFAVSVATK